MGTLGTDRYADIIERLKATGRRANKKVYVFLVGKPNVAKLANFPEIEVRAANDPSVFTITENALTSAFYWLKASTSTLTCMTLC